MFDDVLEIVKRAGIFLIISQSLLHLCASDSYEKYIKMLVGLVTVMMLIFPIFTFFRENNYKSFEEYRRQYEEKIFGDSPDFEKIRDDGYKIYDVSDEIITEQSE